MSHSQQIFQLSGTTVASILNPEQKKQPKVTKNHQADYIQQLREMQRENRIRKERERYDSEKKEFKLKQFTSVKPKVDISTPHVLNENKENTIQKDFSKIQRDQLKVASQKNANEKIQKGARKEKTISKPHVPKHDETLDLKRREERNFLNENTKTVIQSKPVKVKKEEKDEIKHKHYGKVPTYIQKYNFERENEIARQKELAEMKRDCPPGMKLMPDDERLETLKCLEENRETINAQLIRFPIVCDTLGLKRKKGILEQRLQEIEDAIKLFSRPHVYVTE